MTFKYKNVYINETATISGPYEKEGPMMIYILGRNLGKKQK